jgi:hypothetical protein
VRAAVERHVLDEVGEAELIRLLEKRSRLDGEPQRGALRRPAVPANEVGEAVRQLAGPNRRIERNRLLKVDRLRGDRDEGQEREREPEKYASLHDLSIYDGEHAGWIVGY